jgi:Peptidase family M23
MPIKHRPLRRPQLLVGFFCALTAICLAPAAPAQSADPISLSFPMKCELGSTCFFQNYVDHDPSDNVRDYQCGGRTYNGHDGTDIRIPSAAAQRRGVEVLAAATGRVVAVRDDMNDVSIRIAGKAAVAGRECGNGAVIAHDNGWQTQYCHMAKASLRVHPGDSVAAGQPIGLVGLSGETEFFHLHFTVRQNGRIVDPFAYQAAAASCGGGQSLWVDAIRAQTRYHGGEVLDDGFVDIAPTMELIDSGDVALHPALPGSAALVAYVRAIGLQAGDQQTLTIKSPNGTSFSAYSPPALDHDKAQYLISAGRRRTESAWPAGSYVATYSVVRNGAEVLHKVFETQLGALAR